MYLYRKCWAFVLRDTEFNSIIPVIYLLDMTFLWNKFEISIWVTASL